MVATAASTLRLAEEERNTDWLTYRQTATDKLSILSAATAAVQDMPAVAEFRQGMMDHVYDLAVYRDLTIKFKLTDAIFDLVEPVDEYFPDEKACHVCLKKLKKKARTRCDFCGHPACRRHNHKFRVFAGQKVKESSRNLSLSELQRTCKTGRCC